MKKLSFIITILLLALAPSQGAEPKPDLRVVTDFPGGNANAFLIDQTNRVIHLDPFAYPSKGWDCWWYLKVEGIVPGETITLNVGKSVWSTPDQCAFSVDNEAWHHTAKGERSRMRIIYQQVVDADHCWFAWGPPFVLNHARALVEQSATRCADAQASTLVTSRAGHAVPLLKVGAVGKSDRPAVWIQARQHAWESGSSWVCRGFMEWLTSDDAEAVALRERAEIWIVPIMDIDSVQMGAGGKDQKPQDHNRDWSDAPHWPEVAAAQQHIKRFDEEGRFQLFVDLHNPGPRDSSPYFYIPPRDNMPEVSGQNLDRFLTLAQDTITGPLAYRGKTIESGAAYDPKNWTRISKNWVEVNTRPNVVAVTLETTWNSPNSTQEHYQRVGRELGKTIEKYLR